MIEGVKMVIQKTILRKPSEIKKKWILIDAKGQTLERLASVIANILQGKNKPDYVPYWDNGDNIIVINASKIKVTGNKLEDKKYYWHSGYPGGIKERSLKEMMEKDPTFPLRKAVKGMLPKNRLARKLLRNLKIYADEKHPHQAQNPEEYKISY